MSDISSAQVKELREITGVGMMECKKALVEAKGDMQLAIDNMRKRGQARAANRAGKTAAEGAIVVALSSNKTRAFMLEVNCETDFVARDASFRAFATQLAEAGLQANATDVVALMTESLEAERQSLVLKIGENIQPRRVASLSASGCINFYLHGDRIGVLVALDKNNPELAKDIAMHVAASNPLAVDASALDPAVLEKEREIITAQAQGSGKPASIIEKMVEGRLQKFVQEVCLVHQPFVKDTEKTVETLLKAAQTKVLTFVRFVVGEGIEKQRTDLAAEVAETLKGTH